ncbi:Ornithine carbamoyltransferase OS=Streptomyces rimosus subsp. rimosus (strain ATCC / DSM 40260/ JCM 4667 / NRRL 2234) OX=1265868 GN=argF PE=3 SV=1 [Streptomyces rimosus subsp. rimosus]
MATDLKGRHFLKELDFTAAEFGRLVDLAAELKAAKRAGEEVVHLRGRNIALIFEKTSTRTRCAFEVAAADQGASTTYLDPAASQIGHKESVKDTARVLGRMYDAIEYRGGPGGRRGTGAVRRCAGPQRPDRPLAPDPDARRRADHARARARRPLPEIAFAYLGDARYNMGNSI